ncbi:plasma kallikrein-like, partial [Convolutriloba macropyga]|uniref:plasma kallikrein-like n=1 Tax=Convolutriloba macropyga TaxID=536237 RepID=UPI003F5288BA
MKLLETIIVIVSFAALNLRLNSGEFEYFKKRKQNQERTGFYDPDLRMPFMKANLICNGCNGYLLGDDVACDMNQIRGDCFDDRAPLSYVWQSVYFMPTTGNGELKAYYSLFEGEENVASNVGVRNPLFLLSLPCFTAGLKENKSKIFQKPCEQKRPFGCQFATYSNDKLDIHKQSPVCFLQDICITDIMETEAKVGCPYTQEYKSQVVYENSRIINGQIVPYVEHPWVVKLTIKMPDEEAVCGGTIVSVTHVVTARHCFGTESIEWGLVHYSTPTRNDAIKFYHNDVRTSSLCDAAIIQLPYPIVFSRYAMPIKLPDKNDHPILGEWVTVSGFGAWCDREIDEKCSQSGDFRLSDNLRSVFITIQQCFNIQPPDNQLITCF